ncbi:MAG: class I SAM-dependent methyltransferase [Rhodospirillales bacterium]|nr:class I SAM-dependent methyltransferase [Rhodospirillales bacterium]
MFQPSRFWDRHAKSYAERPVTDAAAYEQKLKMTQDYLRPDMDVLELGCGTGTTAIIQAPFVKQIKAVDISKKMLEIAEGKAVSANVNNVKFEQSTIDDLNVDDASYDTVMGHSILHLLEDKEDAIAKVYRMLKPGGVFVTSTPCIGGMMLALKPLLSIGRIFGLVPLVKFFTERELEESFINAGFQIDNQWQPGKRKAVFIVAMKPA